MADNSINNKVTSDKAVEMMLPLVHAVNAEELPLDKCYGRVINGKVTARINTPLFDRSRYDGYALRAADTWDASDAHPVALKILEEIPAGSVPTMQVTPGTAAKILTGAPIPSGADSVVPYEKTLFTEKEVKLTSPVKEGDNMSAAGDDIHCGQVLAEDGGLLTAELAGKFATQGIKTVSVYRKPIIGIITTGSELVELDKPLESGKIYNSNLYTFAAMLKEEGCVPEYLGLAADREEEIAALIKKGFQDCDMILLTGGVCTGDYDRTPKALAAADCEILVRGLDRKNGRNCCLGIKVGTPVCALSGNPKSAVRTYEAVIRPLIHKLQGRSDICKRKCTNDGRSDITGKSTAEFWDSLAKPCSFYVRRSDYADEFIRKSGIRPGDTVLDMGCGSGTLCLPLSDDGHEVFCGDFSEKMLKSVTDVIEEEGIKNITTMLISWQEDWDKRDVPVCDYAFASRCLFDVDPMDAVYKLSIHARKKVCITLPVNADMFKNRFARYEVGEQEDRTKYLVEMISAVYKCGFMPELSYMTGREGSKGWAFVSWETGGNNQHR